ncbi:rRNA maturation RNase YbeY [Synoicihabitans lomoniglobus]|uniref:Endoribonuclease YbeY n=1 Tax=Synoicihabitans lomoniglobus TaxID=2909285 RepID=A0AAF0CQA7_9BACT|nr:rRNA maturation RNase YbeY [Opitutaceae bacterium LMO-M01]WED66101.1 rRNA maturation RNase YbeY [Opitutaceae bacterium LMO-M01]
MPREIAINNAHPRLRLDRKAIRAAIELLDRHAKRFLDGPLPGELSIAFLTDPAIARLHADFLDDPTATDVITFEGEPAFGTAGEICVSADTAASYAAKKGHDFSEELTLYVVHGWLHLAGYDDLEPAKKRRMRAAEARAVNILKEAEACPRFSWKQ